MAILAFGNLKTVTIDKEFGFPSMVVDKMAKLPVDEDPRNK